MRSTHPFEQEEVMAYLDGEITAERATEIALHLQRCAECQELAVSLRNLSQQFAEWEIESSPARLTEQIAAATQKLPATAATLELTPLQRFLGLLFSQRASPWAWATAGALAIILVVTVGSRNLLRAPEAALQAPRKLNASQSQLSSRDAALDKLRAENRTVQALQQRAEKARIASSLENEWAPEETAQTAGMPAPPPPPPGAPASAPMIARTATLSIVVKDFAGVEAAVKGLVSRHSGYVGELNTSTPPDAAKTFSAKLRVPSGQMEAALAELTQLGRSDQETEGGEEVTKQFTDLAARLKNSRATEERLLGVLRNNTGKVKDVLEVENEISRVRGEIEEMEADQRALQSRIDFATISLSVTEEYKASLNAPPSSMGTRLHNSFVEGYQNVSESLIGLIAWFLEAGPTLLLWAAILFFPARWAWKRVRRALAATPKPAAA
jgi:anti-sigma factor RsiW